jgi:hypothetical protein
MHDLLIVLRPFSVYDSAVGRRDLRPGARINLSSDLAERLVRDGYAHRVAAAAPLFAESTDPPEKPMRKRKEPKRGDRHEQPHDPGGAQDMARGDGHG